MNFDEARQASEELFGNEQQNEQQPIDEQPIEEQPIEASPEQQGQQILNETMNTANEAVNSLAQAEAQLQERDAAIAQLQEQLRMSQEQALNQQKLISDLSKKNEEQVIDEVLEMPTLDMNALAFADDETVKKAQEEYAKKMADFIKRPIMDELSPFIERAKEGERQIHKEQFLSEMSELPEFADIREMSPQIDRIIQNNEALRNMPIDDAYVMAAAIAKGVQAMNEPKKEMSLDDMMSLYENNDEFRQAIEQKRIAELKNSQQVPPFSASSGAVNAALNIKEKPKTFEEASERTRRMFGLE